MLTQQQIIQFDTFGFMYLRNLFSPDELEIMNAEYENGLARTRHLTGSPIGRRRQLNWPHMGLETPFLAGLLEDLRICGMAE